jgi:DNA-binding LytR/AlgR family response regulator
MNNIKILIVDDEPLAHKVIESYCEKIDYIEIVGNCYDGLSTLNFLNKNQVDAIFLDIQMPDLTGLELIDSLRSDAPKIIFTTAYTEYALVGFDYDQVVDYLHKPIRLSRFIKAVERLKKLLILENEFRDHSSGTEQVEALDKHNDFISLKDNKTVYRIMLEHILYVQSWGNYLKFFLKSDEVKIVRKTIKELESEIPEKYFLRIHKSYIVNISHVKATEGNQVIIGDQKLPIGKSYAISTKKKLIT